MAWAKSNQYYLVVVGLLLLGSIIGYSGEEIIPDVPKPDAGLCGVTKEAFDTVPGASALLDIEVEVSWDDNTVWIGIISVDDYNSLEKLGGNSDGEIVSCDSRIEFIAGGPSSVQIRNLIGYQMEKNST